MVSLLIERARGWCVSCAFQHWYTAVFVSDRIWPIKHFREFFDPFWSIKLFIAAKWRFNEEFSFSSLKYVVYRATKWLKYFQGTQAHGLDEQNNTTGVNWPLSSPRTAQSNCSISCLDPEYNFQQIVVLFVTRLLLLAWRVCRSVSYYTTVHDWGQMVPNKVTKVRGIQNS